jgi:hypothetical protein
MTLCVMHESGIPLNYSSLPYEGYLGVLRITRITDNGGRYARKSPAQHRLFAFMVNARSRLNYL